MMVHNSQISLTLVLVGSLSITAMADDAKFDYDQHFFGLTTVDLSEATDIFKKNKVKLPRSGALVTEVVPFSPAQRLNIKPMDVIYEINGTITESNEAFHKLADQITPDQKATMKLKSYRQVGVNSKNFRWRTITVTMSPVTYSDWLFSLLRTEVDEVEKVTTLTSKFSPQTRAVSNVHLRIRQNAGQKPELFLQFQYCSEDWLFVESHTFSIDGGTKRPIKSTARVFRDNGIVKGDVLIWEWQTVPVDSALRKILADVAESERTILRYSGREFYKDREVSAVEKSLISIMLLAYDAKLATHGKPARPRLVQTASAVAKKPTAIKAKPASEVAAGKLRLVKRLLALLKKKPRRTGNLDAKRRLKEIIDDYPKTDAAKEAEKLLKKLK